MHTILYRARLDARLHLRCVAIFSFVFGDGDPNVAIRAARLCAMAEVIRANGGAVVAENLAPFLDPKPPPSSSSTAFPVCSVPAAAAHAHPRLLC